MPVLESWVLWLHIIAGTIAVLAGSGALVRGRAGVSPRYRPRPRRSVVFARCSGGIVTGLPNYDSAFEYPGSQPIVIVGVASR